MIIKWKKVKQLTPFCGVCGEELSGNNSGWMPYKCKCGIWKSDWEKPFEFELVKTQKIEK